MSNDFCKTAKSVLIPEGELSQLVRGREQWLLDRLMPLVRQQSVALDLSLVDRIDAAGIAALIALYGSARDAGYHFSVANASARVAGMLALVGLDRILLSHTAVHSPGTAVCEARSAA